MMRIAVGGLVHETNTFAPTPTTLADFDMDGSSPRVQRGAGLVATLSRGSAPMAGILRELGAAPHVTLVPLLWAEAQPGGLVTREAFDVLAGEFLQGLDQVLEAAGPLSAGPLSAVVLDLHGAMVVEGLPDAEGWLLQEVRQRLGEGPFLAAALDFHGNLSAGMVEASDLLIGYRTYPHVDMAETGARAARETLGWLARGARPAKAFARLPYLIPIHAQSTLGGPMAALVTLQGQLDRQFAATTSLFAGFPPADIRDCGPAILAYAPDQAGADAAVAQLEAAALAAEPAFAAIGLRTGFDAVREAMGHPPDHPVIIVDTQDNPGAGATSDTMGLVRELLAQGAQDAVVAVIHDPAAAGLAHAAGVGGIVTADLGGRGASPGAGPLRGDFRVEALGDGAFTGSGGYYRNTALNFGPMALLRVAESGVRVIVGSRRAQAGTQAIFRHLGLDPARIGILGLKSSVHFLADFADLTPDILYAAFPGLNAADPAEFDYRNLRPDVRRRPRAGPQG